MSKYIIELEDDIKYLVINGRADNRCYTLVRPVAELEELNSDYINEHFGYLQDEAYLKGFKDGKNQKEDDRIEVGDEVIYNGTTRCLVIVPETDERYASLLDCNGIHYSADHRECKKTGKHYDIQSILEAMRE